MGCWLQTGCRLQPAAPQRSTTDCACAASALPGPDPDLPAARNDAAFLARSPIGRGNAGIYTVAELPRMTVLCDDSTPPLPCAIAVSAPGTWRAPHSPRSCRTASISRNSPYMPGWQ